MLLTILLIISVSMITFSLMMLAYIEYKESVTPTPHPDSDWFQQGYAVKIPSELDEVMEWLEHYGDRPDRQ